MVTPPSGIIVGYLEAPPTGLPGALIHGDPLDAHMVLVTDPFARMVAPKHTRKIGQKGKQWLTRNSEIKASNG